MKKLIYIAVVFIAVLLFNSCEKRHFEPCEKDDPFEISTSDNVKALSDNDGDDGLGIVDPDDDDDDMDEDDNKHVED